MPPDNPDKDHPTIANSSSQLNPPTLSNLNYALVTNQGLESDPKKVVRNFKWKRCSILANPNVVATLWKFEIGRKFVKQ